GANGALSSLDYFLKATALRNLFNSAPEGGAELLPSPCWQTITFSHATDPAITYGTGAAITDANPFCALEGLEFSIDDTDTGPYDIYVDSIYNGNTVIEDFEGHASGDIVTFVAPNAAGSPPAGSTYLGTPNSAAVSQVNAFDGTNACRIQWQWQDAIHTAPGATI